MYEPIKKTNKDERLYKEIAHEYYETALEYYTASEYDDMLKLYSAYYVAEKLDKVSARVDEAILNHIVRVISK